MLPNGIDTKDNALMAIENIVTGKTMGIIWYSFEITDGIKHSFLNDFIIKEEERQKGYATAALMGMEQDAKKYNCTESRLYVWKHNPLGVNLYTKCGYNAFKQSDDGMCMKKLI